MLVGSPQESEQMPATLKDAFLLLLKPARDGQHPSRNTTHNKSVLQLRCYNEQPTHVNLDRHLARHDTIKALDINIFLFLPVTK